MKHVILDAATSVVLGHTEDARIASLMKSVMPDVDTLPVFDVEEELYQSFNETNFHLCDYRFTRQSGIEVTIADGLKMKKLLASYKLRALGVLLRAADYERTRHANFIVDGEALRVLLADKNKRSQYAAIRRLDEDAALKELQLRFNSEEAAIIKTQALVDYFTEKIARAETADNLRQIVKDIEYLFFNKVTP